MAKIFNIKYQGAITSSQSGCLIFYRFFFLCMDFLKTNLQNGSWESERRQSAKLLWNLTNHKSSAGAYLRGYSLCLLKHFFITILWRFPPWAFISIIPPRPTLGVCLGPLTGHHRQQFNKSWRSYSLGKNLYLYYYL